MEFILKERPQGPSFKDLSISETQIQGAVNRMAFFFGGQPHCLNGSALGWLGFPLPPLACPAVWCTTLNSSTLASVPSIILDGTCLRVCFDAVLGFALANSTHQ